MDNVRNTRKNNRLADKAKKVWRRVAPRLSVTVPVLVFGVLLVLSGEGWRWNQRQREASARHETELVAAQLAVRLEVFIAARLIVGAHMAHEWHEGEYKTMTAFAKEARFFHLSFPGIWAINLVDRHGIVRWITPEIHIKRIVGLDISTVPPLVQSLHRGRQIGNPARYRAFRTGNRSEGFCGLFPVASRSNAGRGHRCRPARAPDHRRGHPI